MSELRGYRSMFLVATAVAIVCLAIGYLVAKRLTVENESETVFAKVSGQSIYGRDVLPGIQKQIEDHEKAIFRLKRAATEEALFAKLPGTGEPSETAKAEGEIDEAALQAWAGERGLRFGKLTPKQREDLGANYRIQTRHLRASADRRAALNGAGVEWFLRPTYRTTFVKISAAPLSIFSSGDARNIIVLFANFHCGNCANIALKMRELAAAAGEGTSISMRFNIQEGDSPIVARTARAAICARDQKKFAEFFEAASRTPPVDVAALQTITTSLSIDAGKLDSCIDDKTTEATLSKDVEESKRLSASGAPIAVVNGFTIPLQEPLDEYLVLMGR